MSVLLYAITDEPSTAADRVVEGPLTALVSEQIVGHDRADLWRYERAVEELMRDNALLPARFGSVFDGEDSIRALLRDRRAELSAALDFVRGAVELALRASWDKAGAAARSQPKSGAEYMHQRLQLHRGARAVARALEPLTALSRTSRLRVLPNPELPLLGAYLVDAARVGEFTDRVAQLDNDLDDVELVCTGPWPPYSFAEGVVR
jgi:Gas vesicle synthesis protein GvpL/GvpF